MTNTPATPPQKQKAPRRRFDPASWLKIERLKAGLTLQAVTIEAGISLFAGSRLERDPDAAPPERVRQYREALDRLLQRRNG